MFTHYLVYLLTPLGLISLAILSFTSLVLYCATQWNFLISETDSHATSMAADIHTQQCVFYPVKEEEREVLLGPSRRDDGLGVSSQAKVDHQTEGQQDHVGHCKSFVVFKWGLLTLMCYHSLLIMQISALSHFVNIFDIYSGACWICQIAMSGVWLMLWTERKVSFFLCLMKVDHGCSIHSGSTC